MHYDPEILLLDRLPRCRCYHRLAHSLGFLIAAIPMDVRTNKHFKKRTGRQRSEREPDFQILARA